MDSVRVRTQVSVRATTESGKEITFLTSDKIMVMNPKGEIIEYGGSMPSIPSYY